ncbi:hypothetical protein IPG41_06240 [Candidatus Peregrinibacteria bacterium]|nr:MAG: hypothetical protein IPG41_06240 [Candidatus Peregrinibacteria bacterium]
MKSFFIQYGPYFLLAFIVGFLFPRLSASSVQSAAINYDAMENMDEMILAFHTDMNTTTNLYLERMFENPQPNVLYPAAASGCDDENLSTYCLAVVLNEKLLAFETAMLSRKDSLADLDGSVSSEEATQFANQQVLVVNEQLQNAEAALDLTLSTYNQVQMVYPLHLEMENFRANLENFRDNLAAVRDVVELYPSKFNGASTAQCK